MISRAFSSGFGRASAPVRAGDRADGAVLQQPGHDGLGRHPLLRVRGTALASGTSGGVLGYTGTGTLASSALLTANGVLLGGGAGATPTALGAMTNGQLVIGSTSASPVVAALTQTANQVIVTNAAGSITLSTPQSIATASTPQFLRLGLNQAADSSARMAATGQYFSTNYALSDGATIALDWDNGNVQYVTLAGNRTFTFANPKQGGRYVIFVKQDGTGTRTLTWPTITWSGGSAPVLTTTIDKGDIIALVYINSVYYGSSVANF